MVIAVYGLSMDNNTHLNGFLWGINEILHLKCLLSLVLSTKYISSVKQLNLWNETCFIWFGILLESEFYTIFSAIVFWFEIICSLFLNTFLHYFIDSMILDLLCPHCSQNVTQLFLELLFPIYSNSQCQRFSNLNVQQLPVYLLHANSRLLEILIWWVGLRPAVCTLASTWLLSVHACVVTLICVLLPAPGCSCSFIGWGCGRCGPSFCVWSLGS